MTVSGVDGNHEVDGLDPVRSSGPSRNQERTLAALTV